MKVRILQEGPYSDFSRLPKLGAKVLEAGDRVDFPSYYAEELIASGLVERIVSYNPDVTLGAQKLAQEHGIDLIGIEGTGKEGRIIKADVQRFIDEES